MVRFVSPDAPDLTIEAVPAIFVEGVVDLVDPAQIDRMRSLGISYGVREVGQKEPVPDGTWTARPPESVKYGIVTMRGIWVGPDLVADSENIPSAHPFTGTVTFYPTQSVQYETGSQNAIMYLRQVPAGFSSDGDLINSSGNVGIALVATDSPGLVDKNWKWRAVFTNPDIPDIEFSLLGDTYLDLADAKAGGTGIAFVDGGDAVSSGFSGELFGGSASSTFTGTIGGGSAE